jgi:hypothetical protein
MEKRLQLGLVLKGESEQGVWAVEEQFLADICAMVFDSAVMNEEFAANGLARLAVRHHPKDKSFGSSQGFQARLPLGYWSATP